MTAVTYDQGRLTVEARPDEYALVAPLLHPWQIDGTRCTTLWHVEGDDWRCECGAVEWSDDDGKTHAR